MFFNVEIINYDHVKDWRQKILCSNSDLKQLKNLGQSVEGLGKNMIQISLVAYFYNNFSIIEENLIKKKRTNNIFEYIDTTIILVLRLKGKRQDK